MDDTSAPAPIHTPFKVPSSGTYLYGTWDHRISPHAYIERVLGKFTQSIEDKRSYVRSSLIAYLQKGGAEVIEGSIDISSGIGVSNAETDAIAIILGENPSGDRNYDLLWYKGSMIVMDGREGEVTIEVLGPVGHPIDIIHREFEPFLAPRKHAAVSVLLSTPGGMMTRSVDFEPPIIDDLELNYGKGFGKMDDQIIKKLQSDRAGLVMFHGPPGVGKTVYIKHLTSCVNREFIFIPVGMAGDLSSPLFLSLLLEHEGAILVLEDAEQALQSRETDHWNSSVVATLLNLSDGLLGTLLSIKIIASYNADKQTIDKALLRKGRLMMDVKFNKLAIEDAKRLAVHLKKDSSFITEPTSLADIYNAEDDTGYVPPVEKAMGFGAIGG